MTFEELKQLRKKKEDIVDKAYEDLNKAEWAYIEERLPFPFRKYQRVKVTAEVTEKTRKFLIDSYKAKPRYQLGNRYTVTGMLIGYTIGERGDIRPCFWGGKPHYSLYDKIISIETAKQYSMKCTNCHFYKDGGCYKVDSSKPTLKVDENSFVCGHYYERRRL